MYCFIYHWFIQILQYFCTWNKGSVHSSFFNILNTNGLNICYYSLSNKQYYLFFNTRYGLTEVMSSCTFLAISFLIIYFTLHQHLIRFYLVVLYNHIIIHHNSLSNLVLPTSIQRLQSQYYRLVW